MREAEERQEMREAEKGKRWRLRKARGKGG